LLQRCAEQRQNRALLNKTRSLLGDLLAKDRRLILYILLMTFSGAFGTKGFAVGYPNGFPELAPIGVELSMVTLLGVVMPLLGFWLYRKVENQARHRGSLSEY
jgi:hypothetical protein